MRAIDAQQALVLAAPLQRGAGGSATAPRTAALRALA
jgi:hypothetical protein